MKAIREPEPTAITAFVHALFPYADEGSYVSLRAFDQFNDGVPPPYIVGVQINGEGLDPIINAAVAGARFSANATDALVFAPPIATFRSARGAAEADLINCVCISVEIDAGNTEHARTRLESLLGPATVTVASGGEWIDADTGQVFPKIHLHWRLSEPTRTAEEHAALKHARRLACALVNADPTAKTAVHPLRWPGTWHLKAAPKLARIHTLNEAREVHLVDAIDALETAAESAVLREMGITGSMTSGQPQAPLYLVQSALAALPNPDDEHWSEWIKKGLLTYAATGASDGGLSAWIDWSQKSEKFTAGACEERWQHFATSPPTKGGAGTLFMLAKAAGWTRPEPPPAATGSDAASDMPKVEWRDVQLSSWADRRLPDRQWIVPDWIPLEQTTGLYGEAGKNKTDFLLQLLMATSLGLVFCGHPLTRGPAYGLFCEDTEEEIVRRASRIAGHYGHSLADFTDLHFASLVGFDETEFVTFDGPKLIVGPALLKFDRAIVEYRARIAALDTAPDFFGGEEISRRQVSQFIRRLDAVSMTRHCAMVFTAHPSVRGAASGTMDSGSTGWGGKVRARLSLHDPGEEDEDQDEAEERRRKRMPAVATDRRILTLQKANYARQGTTLELLCRNGVFTTAAPDPARAQARGQRGPIRDAEADAKFLNLFPKAEQSIIYVHNSTKARDHYAPAVFAARKDSGGFSKAEFARAMRRLLEAGRIRSVPFGPPSHGRFKLVVVDAGEGENS